MSDDVGGVDGSAAAGLTAEDSEPVGGGFVTSCVQEKVDNVNTSALATLPSGMISRNGRERERPFI